MRIPSHNTIAAYGALFVALGGTSYAATQIPAGSVGTKAIRSGAVTRVKLSPSARPPTKTELIGDITTTMTSDQVLSALSTAVQGQPGIKGDLGPQGPAGANGQDGPQGPQGVQGTKGDKGDMGSTGPAGTVAGGEVAADGTITDAQHITVTRTNTPTVGTYCIDSDHNVLPSPHGAVVTPEGNGSSQLSAQVLRNPTSGTCSGHDFQVTMMASGTDTDEAFFVLVS